VSHQGDEENKCRISLLDTPDDVEFNPTILKKQANSSLEVSLMDDNLNFYKVLTDY